MERNVDPNLLYERGSILENGCSQAALDTIFNIIEGEFEGYAYKAVTGQTTADHEDMRNSLPHIQVVLANVRDAVEACLATYYENESDGFINPDGAIPDLGYMLNPDLIPNIEGDYDA